MESAMFEFARVVGQAILDHYDHTKANPNAKKGPTLPMDMAGKHHSVVFFLKNGLHKTLKRWIAYMNLVTPKKQLQPEFLQMLDDLEKMRNTFNHNSINLNRTDDKVPIKDDISNAIDLMEKTMRALKLDATPKFIYAKELIETGAAANSTIKVQLKDMIDRMRIPTNDDREPPLQKLVGRKDLVANVKRMLCDTLSARVLLYGQSGAGKMVAAIAAAYEVSETLPLQFLLQGSSPAVLKEELARYAKVHVHDLLPENANEDELVAAAQKKLATLANCCLLVIDDVGPDLEGVLALLPTDHRTKTPTCQVLLTSMTKPNWPTGVQQVEALELLPRQIKELLSLPDRKGVKVHEDVISMAMDFVDTETINLALDVALLKDALKGKTVDEAESAIKSWGDNLTEAFEEARDERSLRRRIGVIQVLEERLEDCQECKSDPTGTVLAAAKSLLAMVSALDPTGVPAELFLWHLHPEQRESFWMTTSLAAELEAEAPAGANLFCKHVSEAELEPEKLVPATVQFFEAAASALENVGLLKRSGSNLVIHQLIQRCVRDLRAKTPSTVQEWSTVTKALVKRFALPIVSSQGSQDYNEDILSLLKPSVTALLRHRITVRMITEDHVALAYGLGAYHLTLQGMENYNSAFQLFEEVLDILRDDPGTNPKDRFNIHNSLGTLLDAMDSPDDALFHFELALDFASPEDKAACLNNMGSLLQSKNRYKKALPVYVEALKIRQNTPSCCAENVATSLNNLGTLFQDMGSYDDALPLLQQALQIRQISLGPKHPDTASSLNNLGSLYQAMESFEVGLCHLKKALEIYQEVLRPDHPLIAIGQNNVGDILSANGDIDEALDYSLKALTTNEIVFGEDHSITATSLNNVGMLLHAKGLNVDAVDHLDKALKIRREKLGSHKDTAASLRNLGRLLETVHRENEAELLLRESLEMNIQMCGPRHVNTVGSRSELGSFLRARACSAAMEGRLTSQQTYQEPLRLLKQAVRDSPEGLVKATTLQNLTEARKLLEKAVKICRAVYRNTDHEDKALALSNLGKVHKLLGNDDEACQLSKEAIKIRLGMHDPAYSATVRNGVGDDGSGSRDGDTAVAAVAAVGGGGGGGGSGTFDASGEIVRCYAGSQPANSAETGSGGAHPAKLCSIFSYCGKGKASQKRRSSKNSGKKK